MAADGDDRSDQREGEEREHERRTARAPRPSGAPALVRLAREVGDEVVEIRVGLRRHAALEPGLELLGVEAPFEVALPESLADRFPLFVADAERTIARTVAGVVSVFIGW